MPDAGFDYNVKHSTKTMLDKWQVLFQGGRHVIPRNRGVETTQVSIWISVDCSLPVLSQQNGAAS